MPLVQNTLHHPASLWHAVRALAPHEGDPTTVVLRAVEDDVTAEATNQDHRTGKNRDLVRALRTPVADLHLSARATSALQMLNIRCVYELAQHSPTDLVSLPNVGNRSLKEVKEKLATLGLTLGMTLEDDAPRAAVVAAGAASIEATRR
jgi:DNA-directed RNA polymerase subunit alpha